jgi:RNA polymerase sigma-70 factor (ECF subfamily)
VTPPAKNPYRAQSSADLLAHLYERWGPLVRSILIPRVGRDDAEDLTHEVFLAALHRLHEIESIHTPAAWLATIARRKAATHRRTLSRWWRRLGRAAGYSLTDKSAWLSAPPTDDAHRILAAIATLPDAYQEPLILRLVQGLSGPHIAQALGMTHGAIRVNLCRGHALLRNALGTPATAPSPAATPPPLPTTTPTTTHTTGGAA